MEGYAGTFPLRSLIEEYGHSQMKLIKALALGEQAQSSSGWSTLMSGRGAEGVWPPVAAGSLART